MRMSFVTCPASPAISVAPCGHWSVGPCDCGMSVALRSTKRPLEVRADEVRAGDEVFTFGPNEVWGHAPAKVWVECADAFRSWEAHPMTALVFGTMRDVVPSGHGVWVRR